MSTGQRRFDRLLLAAAVLEPEERKAFLDGLAEEERDLVDAVRDHLGSIEDLSEGFLKTLATDLRDRVCGASEEAELPPPTGGDRYRVGECLGSGGMARVYRAYDRRLGREVALKILRTSDEEGRRPLLQEARDQARVCHDHVLEVYDTGELDGRAYISMRCIAGGTLADVDGQTSLEFRVRLVAQAAEGLHAAHRQGLLHGDVKPSNILVEETPDGEHRAWISDFGIATEIGQTGGGGQLGRLAGTPQFMAPELLRGGQTADRRCDVFSLGVTLLQVLTGKVPRRSRGGAIEVEKSCPDLPADLAAIVSRCLASEPGERYQSARAVAEELHRFLDGEVVQAYADRFIYRLSRFVVRHRVLVLVGSISTLLLTMALVMAGIMGVRAIQANQRAEDRRLQAEGLIEFMLTDLRDRLDAVGRLDLLDAVGERALRYFAAVPDSELSDQELARRSAALYQIGDVRIRQGDLAGAEAPLGESLVLARRLADRDPDNPTRQFDLAQSEFWVGYANWERGDLDAAEGHFVAYQAIAEWLVERDGTNRQWRRELAYAHSNIGSVREQRGDLSGALERFRAALSIDLGLVADAPTSEAGDGDRFELAATHNTIGVILEELGRLDDAAEHYRADLELRERLFASDDTNRRYQEFLGTSHQHLGALMLARCDVTEARRHLTAARDTFDTLTTHDSKNRDWQYKLAWSELRLGWLARTEGRSDEAILHWKDAAGISAELAGADAKRFDWELLLGVTRFHQSLAGLKPETAHLLALEAVDLLTAVSAKRPEDRSSRLWLAQSLVLLGDLESRDRSPSPGSVELGRRAWQRAAGVLGPLVDSDGGLSRDYRTLECWAGIMDRLHRSSDAALARAALAELGIRHDC